MVAVLTLTVAEAEATTRRIFANMDQAAVGTRAVSASMADVERFLSALQNG